MIDTLMHVGFQKI